MHIDILDMIDDAPPESQVKGSPILYGSGGFFIKDPKLFNRDEKLAYVEHKYKTYGLDADSDKFIHEIRCGRGVSLNSFNASRKYGLYIYYKKKEALS